MSERRTLKLPARATPAARTRSGPLRPVAPRPKREQVRAAEPPVSAPPADEPPKQKSATPAPPKPKAKPSRPAAADRTGEAARTPRKPAPRPRPAPPPKAPSRKAAADTAGADWPRLSKLMSERGLCSRREADEWIANRWVSVNGRVVDQLGTRVPPDAHIEVGSAARKHQSETVTILLHKPLGYVSGQAEDGYQPAVTLVKPDARWSEDTLPRQFRPAQLRGLAPAGRLDIDSTGLLVLTKDGRVARHLIGDDSTVEKEYLVRVEGSLSEADLKRLNHGLSLDGVKLKPARVSWQNEHQLRFVLREGKKRQIRRMCELVGLRVTGLKRIRIGSVTLGKLPVGQWRYLRPDERF